MILHVQHRRKREEGPLHRRISSRPDLQRQVLGPLFQSHMNQADMLEYFDLVLVRRLGIGGEQDLSDIGNDLTQLGERT